MTPTQRRVAIECRSTLSMCAALIDEALKYSAPEECALLLVAISGALLGPDGVAYRMECLVDGLRGEG